MLLQRKKVFSVLNDLFSSVLSAESATGFSIGTFLSCILCSLVFGALISLVYTFRNSYTKSFVMTLALLPAIVQIVIMLVNGNLGTGVAVMGAFSLVRFRSVPGSAREICSIFFAMAVGLATGMGYLAAAALFVVILGAASLLYTALPVGETKRQDKLLRVTIPETLDYTGVFNDLFEKYTARWELAEVKTTNMGSLFKLTYQIRLRDLDAEKEFLDELRCRNGNLEISCAKTAFERDGL